MGRNGKFGGFVAIIVIVVVVGTPHGVPMIDSFDGLQQAEARLITKYKHILCNIPLLRSEERKYIVWLQQSMYRKRHIYRYVYIYFYN